MKTSLLRPTSVIASLRRLLLLAFVILHSSVILHAAPPPELTLLRQQYDKVYSEQVTAPYDAGLSELNTRYVGGLDRAIAEAKQAGKLEIILALDAEKKRLADKLPIPAIDEESEPATLKTLRPIYREQLAKLTEQRAANQSSILPGYTAKLQELEATLVKVDRVAEATEVLTYRKGLASDAPPAVPAEPMATTAPPGAPAAPATATAAASPKVKGDDRKAAEWVLANWSDFQIVIDDGKPVKTTVDLPDGKFAIQVLAIDGSSYTGGPLTGEMLQVLAGLEGLKQFTFSNFPDITDADMAFLASLTALEELKLVKLGITDAVVPTLVGHRTLEALELSESPGIMGLTLDRLARNNVAWLKLWKCRVTDEGVAKITQLPGLTYLSIGGNSGITNAAIPHLRTMPALRSLNIAETGITPEGFGGKAMPKVTSLGANNLAGLPLSELAPKLALVFPNVTIFELTHSANTPEDLAALVHFKDLEALNTSGNIKDEALPGLLELRGLQSFREKINSFSDRTLQTLAQLKKLKTVRYGTKVPNAAALAAFQAARPDVKIGP